MRVRQGMWLALFVAVPLLACGAGEPGETPDAEMPDVEPAPETETAEPADPMPETTAEAVEQAVSVTNNMPHTMVVSVVEDGEPRELARVDPDATESISVEGAPGSQVALVAADEGETHEVDFTVEVGATEPQTWSIGGGN